MALFSRPGSCSSPAEFEIEQSCYCTQPVGQPVGQCKASAGDKFLYEFGGNAPYNGGDGHFNDPVPFWFTGGVDLTTGNIKSQAKTANIPTCMNLSKLISISQLSTLGDFVARNAYQYQYKKKPGNAWVKFFYRNIFYF